MIDTILSWFGLMRWSVYTEWEKECEARRRKMTVEQIQELRKLKEGHREEVRKLNEQVSDAKQKHSEERTFLHQRISSLEGRLEYAASHALNALDALQGAAS